MSRLADLATGARYVEIRSALGGLSVVSVVEDGHGARADPRARRPAPRGDRAAGQEEGVDMTRLFFMAHPVGGDVAGNLARAKRWLVYLFLHYHEIVVVAPWITDLEILPLGDAVAEERERGIQRNLVTLGRCDGIILCGGRVSAGMERELVAARILALDIIDLVYLGPEPPPIGDDR